MIELLNMDCMTYMAGCEDNAFDLAIVDPPYGIDVHKMAQGKGGKRTGANDRNYKKGEWDTSPPEANYFQELFRVSREQIVWGANYYPQHFKASSGWVLWDKGQRLCQADGELAFTSFDKPLRVWEQNRVVLLQEGTIHPCQKPIKLYVWLMENYAQPGQRILDTHLGSGSSAIAAHYFGCDFVGMEIDQDYYNAAVERFNNETKQVAMF